MAGKGLRDLLEAYPDEVYGKDAERFRGRSFPLLVKSIDARKDLSVQVHPDEETARALGGEPKAEAWVILQADPKGRILCGLRAGVDREELRRCLAEGTVPSLLNEHRVREGEVYSLPAGTVHALGGGVLLAEIQQNADTTYRLYDWGRVGLDGNPRELHIEKALRAVCIGSKAGPVVPGGSSGDAFLVESSCFRIRRCAFSREGSLPTGDRLICLGVLAGAGTVSGEPFRAGDWFLVPACLGTVSVRSSGASEMLAVTVP
jgi:mannose-6-phosphate isomerase